MKLLKSRQVYINNTFIPASILINDDKIIDILPYEYHDTNIEIIDFKNNYLTPGIIDIHNHGFAGWAFTSVLDKDDLILLSDRKSVV